MPETLLTHSQGCLQEWAHAMLPALVALVVGGMSIWISVIRMQKTSENLKYQLNKDRTAKKEEDIKEILSRFLGTATSLQNSLKLNAQIRAGTGSLQPNVPTSKKLEKLDNAIEQDLNNLEILYYKTKFIISSATEEKALENKIDDLFKLANSKDVTQHGKDIEKLRQDIIDCCKTILESLR